MLQFSAVLFGTITKSIRSTPWRVARSLSSTGAHPNPVIATDDLIAKDGNKREGTVINAASQAARSKAARREAKVVSKKPEFDASLLQNATSMNDFLNIVDNYTLSKKNSEMLLSAITQFMNSKNIDIKTVETDRRFFMLQQIALSNNFNTREMGLMEQYGSLSTPEMLRVINRMVLTKNKDILALKYLMNEITKYNAVLTLTQCAQLMSAMAAMDFRHKPLLSKICQHIMSQNASKATVNEVVAIALLFGLLRYRDSHALDSISTILLYNDKPLSSTSFTSVLLTFSMLSYKPKKVEALINKFVPNLKEEDFPHKLKWLQLVWSLTVFDMANEYHYKSTFSPAFLNELNTQIGWRPGNVSKLLNIKAAAELKFGDSLGAPVLPPLEYTSGSSAQLRYKKTFLSALEETLKNLLPPTADFAIGVDTEMGFNIDGECYVNSNGQFVKKDSTDVKFRIALLMALLSDYCRGEAVLLGAVQLRQTLLEKKGYKVVIISEKHYYPSDIVLKRKMYLETEIAKVLTDTNQSKEQNA